MLPIFPEQVLDNSLHTAILLGLLVTWASYELLGWVFAGFVVAGYLSALAIVSPPSLAVVLVESILTYGLVWTLAAGLPAAGFGSRVFGRERFLLFVLVAVPVRLLVTGFAMPHLQARLLTGGVSPETLGLGLFGVGVVLVPLTANTFWKVGLSRGLLQLTGTAGTTWVLVSALVAWTNFGFGDFERTFDALAVSAWTSSRAVLVLVCTVFLAARVNLRFGWDFGGILVPALLSMLVFTPLKYGTTLVEIGILYVLYEGLVRLPGIRDLDLEGARRIVSIYTVSWLWKFLVAVALGALALDLPASDLFGFGYLLTALVVARAHKARSLGRTLLPLVATSLAGVALAVPLGALLAAAPTVFDEAAPPALEEQDPLRLVLALSREVVGDPRGLDPLAAPAELPRPTLGCAAAASPRRAPAPGRPHVVGCATEGPLLVVPAPRGDPDAVWLAGMVLSRGGASGLVMASVDAAQHPTRAALAPSTRASALEAALDTAGDRAVVLVVTADVDAPHLFPRDAVAADTIPRRLDLPGLRLDTGSVPPLARDGWDALRPGDAVLALSARGTPGPSTLPPSPRVTLRAVPSLTAGREGAPADVLADVFVPALRRTVEHARHDAPLPDSLRALAEVVSVSSWQAVDREGRTHWVFARDDAAGRTTDRWLARPGGSAWRVATGQAWRWPGSMDVAVHLHRSLDAQLTWLAAPPPGDRARVAEDPSRTRRGVDQLSRALLSPPESWRDEDVPHPDVRLALAAPAPDRLEGLRVTFGDEARPDRAAAALRPLLESALEPWPGWDFAATGEPASTWEPALAYAVAYARALRPDDGAVVLWYPSELLREPSHADDRPLFEAWHTARGIPIVRAEGDAGFDPPGDPVRVPELEAALDRHVTQPSDASLAGLRAFDGWTLRLVDTGLRQVLVARGTDVTCARVAAHGETVAWPWAGCWRNR